jgi:NADH dehydrogenase
MAEIARKSMTRDFRHIDPSAAQVVLVEGGPRVLAAYNDDLSAYAKRALERMGVQVRLNSIVTRIDESGVYVGEDFIPARNVMWAAGVTASPLGKRLDANTDKVGRVHVNPDLSLPDDPRVFVIGDLANVTAPDGKPYPGVAQVAMQGGTHAAKMIIADMKGGQRKPFRYHDKGSMATIGRRAAVLQTAHTRLIGWIAWMAWLFVHILFLIGFRNRISVFVQWAWSYLTWQRGARLITGPVTPELKAEGYLEAAAAPPSDAAQAEAVGNQPAADERGWMGGDTHQAAAGRA